MADIWQKQILGFWFDELEPKDWWKKNEALDTICRERFLTLWEEKQSGGTQEFVTDPEKALAATILFDQFPRNMFRGSAKAFSTDNIAQNIASAAVEAGLDQELSKPQRPFLYMPFMHAEDIALQEKSLALFGKLGSNEKFARNHHEVIAKFGRFPHRNEILGRQSTPEELKAIADGASW